MAAEEQDRFGVPQPIGCYQIDAALAALQTIGRDFGVELLVGRDLAGPFLVGVAALPDAVAEFAEACCE